MTTEDSLEAAEGLLPKCMLLKMIREDIFLLFLNFHSELVTCLVSSGILIMYSTMTKDVVTACE